MDTDSSLTKTTSHVLAESWNMGEKCLIPLDHYMHGKPNKLQQLQLAAVSGCSADLYLF